jgi:predicted phage-related endonuclease
MSAYTIITADQRSPEWFAARLGRLTGSRAKDMLATIKTGEAAARRDYRTQLVVERLTGELQEDVFVNKEMQRGIDKEPDAFAAFEALTGHLVRRTGFVQYSGLWAGCSLDGDIDDMTEIVELKCPKSATHLRYLRSTSIPGEHYAQLMHNLWITGAKKAHFFSFDDRFPPALRTFHLCIDAADVDLAFYDTQARAFLAECDTEYKALATMADLAGTLKAAV